MHEIPPVDLGKIITGVKLPTIMLYTVVKTPFFLVDNIVEGIRYSVGNI